MLVGPYIITCVSRKNDNPAALKLSEFLISNEQNWVPPIGVSDPWFFRGRTPVLRYVGPLRLDEVLSNMHSIIMLGEIFAD